MRGIFDNRTRRGGFTLVEVMVAMLVMSGVVLVILSVALSSRQNISRDERKARMTTATRGAIDSIKRYIRDSGGTLSHPDDACGTGCSPSGGGCPVLQTGCQHEITVGSAFMPDDLYTNKNARIRWTVTNTTLGNDTVPKVTFATVWDE